MITFEEEIFFLIVQDFSVKPDFVESVAFHHEMFCLTNFGLDLGVCIVNAMILIKKKNHGQFNLLV